jgi:alkyldihydroxyacetonephosphate synthase
VEAVLKLCGDAGVQVIPWGGGTSVTGGVNVVPGPAPVLTLDLAKLSGLRSHDQVSGLATFGAGTSGPAVEAALARVGMTLGHFPQSWELSTVGGWVVTRSSGQESLGYGRIEDMVAGLELVAPAGRLTIPVQPASAAGPDLRHLILGSEGRLGIVTEVTLRVRPKPREMEVEAALLPDFEAGLDAVREMVQAGLHLTLLRLSDAPETEVAMATGLAASRMAPLVRTYLRVRGIGGDACLLLCGAAGEPDAVDESLAAARALLRRHGGVVLGRRPGNTWKHDRFRHPYLRDALLDIGYATDTLETAVPWSRVHQTRTAIARAISESLQALDQQVAVLCHVSHPYRDGASLYFTMFFRNQADPEETVARWAEIKRAASAALVACGATISHHHGVGQWHAPWLKSEIGELGHSLITAAADRLDPDHLLNPKVLLDGQDRLGL